MFSGLGTALPVGKRDAGEGTASARVKRVPPTPQKAAWEPILGIRPLSQGPSGSLGLALPFAN